PCSRKWRRARVRCSAVPLVPMQKGPAADAGALAGAARGEELAVTVMDPARRGEVGCGERSWCGSRALRDVRTALDFRGRDFTPMAEPGPRPVRGDPRPWRRVFTRLDRELRPFAETLGLGGRVFTRWPRPEAWPAGGVLVGVPDVGNRCGACRRVVV